MNEYLFSYGTLQEERVQLALFGRLLGGTEDILRGYRTSSVEITDKTFLSKGEKERQLTAVRTSGNGDPIQGMVFEITADELLKADTYEPENYARVKVELESGKRAWLYLIVE